MRDFREGPDNLIPIAIERLGAADHNPESRPLEKLTPLRRFSGLAFVTLAQYHRHIGKHDQKEPLEMITIDRFEGDMAVFDYRGLLFSIPRELLPRDAREGDIVNLTIEVDRTATMSRKEHIKKLEKRLFEEG